jgi:hypothetical protein
MLSSATPHLAALGASGDESSPRSHLSQVLTRLTLGHDDG